MTRQPSYEGGGYTADSPNGAPKKRRRIWTIVFWVALVVFIGSAVTLGVIGYGYWAANNRYQQLSESFDVGDGALGDMTVDWASLSAINPDIVAWIYVPGTVINYPVVHTDDNYTYLNTNFDGETGLATGCGTIFLDQGNKTDFTDQNEILYGHHRNDGTMFAALSDFSDSDTFNAHRTIYVLTPTTNYRLNSFSLIRTTGEDRLVQTNFSNEEQMRAYVQDKISRCVPTVSGPAIDAASVKHIFTLSTCDYNEYNGRAVLFASIVETATPTNAQHVVGTYVPATE